MTPPALRFLGRRVYLATVVVVATALMHGVTPERLNRLRKLTGVSLRTLKRWRVWWLSEFVHGPSWKGAQGFFMPPLDEAHLPLTLLERFGDLTSDEGARRALLGVLTFIALWSSKMMGIARPQKMRAPPDEKLV
jgi:hypothetical protein